ncbi:MAG: DUF1501 domain-containing protein [Cytophagales bacterium]|nr:MAG: DUF1501 domain-containing protein [Cytophagales bacterium]
MTQSRRKFIKNATLATAGTALLPEFLSASQSQLAEAISRANIDNKVLVVIQLSGGNDGLNCLVPFRNDNYYKLRPKISIPRDEVYEVNDEMGFHSELRIFKDFYDQGILSVINTVGFQNVEKTHIRAMETWQTASGTGDYINRSGWIGRYLDHGCQNAACRKPYMALEMDDSLNLALKGDKTKGLAFIDPTRTYNNFNNTFFKEVAKIREDALEGTPLHFLYKTLGDSLASVNHIYERSKVFKTKTPYPLTQFGVDLRTVAELIISNMETKVYYVSLPGFDTHVDQLPKHEKILAKFSDGMKSFIKDLKANRRLEDVMVMVFSEFGRTVKENESEGTDHGLANNVFLLSGSLKKKGLYNPMPSLANEQLDDFCLRSSVDFKTIYSTIIKRWLNAEDKLVLGREYGYLDFI